MNIPALRLTLFLTSILALTALLLVPNANAEYDSEENEFLRLLNNYRAQNGLGPVVPESRLTTAAQWMAHDLGANHYFDHIDSEGRTPGQRMCDFDYCYSTWKGEDIAAGYTSAQAAFNAFRSSAPHDAVMRGANYTAVGIARVFVPGSDYNVYWTVDFGGIRCFGDFDYDLKITGSDLLQMAPLMQRSEIVSQYDTTFDDHVNGADLLALAQYIGKPCS